MKKICFYMAHLAKGGTQRVIVNLTEDLLRKGYEVTIVTTGHADVEYPVPDGAKRIFSDIVGDEVTDSRLKNFFRRLKKLRGIWKLENPDAIVSFIGLNNMMTIVSSLFLKTRVLISVRANPSMEYPTKVYRLISKTLFILADGIILQTKDQMTYFPRLIQQKCVILPNPLNPEFVKTEAVCKKEKQIVAVGRVDKNKNHKMLIEAFMEIAEEYPDWCLKIYGDGEEKSKLEQLVQQSELSARVELPGNVSDVPQRLEQARIYVLTSNEEGMPNSLLEAMVKGLACISTDCPCGGPAELIRSGENGILVPVRDVRALADALRSILLDETYERKLAGNALKIKEALDADLVCEQWRKYIEV